jgi:GMP synthase-like glutamine amidotransferase
MRILVFRHVPFEDIGLIRTALESLSVQIDYADLYRNLSSCPDPASYHALIFMGGPMSVNDDLPYIRRELAIIAQAAARRQPVLGICLGAQLIAKAMGARVYPNVAKEVGWYPVRFTQAAAHDPLLCQIESPQELFHWHGETFDLPAGAVLLASSALCRNQAFQIGNVLYGFQFHLEVTPEMIADWCTQDENCGDVRELTAPLDSQKNKENLSRLSQRVFSRWAMRFRPLENEA